MMRSSLDLIDRASVPMNAREVDRLLVFRRHPRSLRKSFLGISYGRSGDAACRALPPRPSGAGTPRSAPPHPVPEQQPTAHDAAPLIGLDPHTPHNPRATKRSVW
jgi:hypothetical protein